MKKTCPNCRLVNFSHSDECARCQFRLIEVSNLPANGEKSTIKSRFWRRAFVCAAVCVLTLFGFYLSMLLTASKLKYEEKQQIQTAVKILEDKGFDREALLLNYLTSYRANDNWLNASTRLENAYAATNFPFEIMTVYPDFFTNTLDDTERAAILLHEAQHLKGADEREAYEFVWRSRQKLGWTRDKYANSNVWRSVRRQTKEYAPNIFVCAEKEAGDCTD